MIHNNTVFNMNIIFNYYAAADNRILNPCTMNHSFFSNNAIYYNAIEYLCSRFFQTRWVNGPEFVFKLKKWISSKRVHIGLKVSRYRSHIPPVSLFFVGHSPRDYIRSKVIGIYLICINQGRYDVGAKVMLIFLTSLL